jgi:cyclopropane-fatty-acyl-phospholipid synthase
MLLLKKRVAHEFLETCAAVTNGSLRVITPDGAVHDFGAGSPQAELRIHDWAMVTACALRGDVGFGESYVAGLWDTPSVEILGQVALLNLPGLSNYTYGSWFQRLKFRLTDTLLRANSRKGSVRNIHAHYDVGNEFYQLWLDPSMTYSSALFDPKDTDLHRAQTRKYDRILSRMGDGARTLEIGCGWGGFAERAADQGRDVTALTISTNQRAYADARLDGRAKIALCDYRDAKGKYDNIVSIEMIEAVGERYWPTYFATLKARMAEGGRAVLQAITVPDAYFDTYRNSSDFIRQHVFPGGMLLSNAQIAAQAKLAGLQVTETFGFGRDYAQTCRLWGQRLHDQREKIAKQGYDAAFVRSWTYYLGICAAAFEIGQTDVVQVQLQHAYPQLLQD